MPCPYAGCGGDPRTGHSLSHCDACARPILLCPKCKTPNSTFARYCRQCGEPKDRQGLDFLQSEKLELWGASVRVAEPRLVEVNAPFWVAPVEYREFLWCLSSRGSVYRLSLMGEEAEHVGSFGEGFGSIPFAIAEVPNDASLRDWTPYLIAANRGTISGLNLITLETRQFLQLDRNEHVLASFKDQYVTLIADGRRVYFLKTKGTQTYLSVCDLLDGSCEDYSLGTQPVAGPFSVGRDVGVYSNSRVRVLEDGAVKDYPLPRNFEPWVSPSESGELQTPLGRMPFMSHGKSVYIPGRQVELGSGDGLSGLSIFSLSNGSSTSTEFIPARDETSYWQDSESRPVIAQKGMVTVYDGGRGAVVRKKDQIVGRGPGFHENNLTVCFAKSSGGAELLRFYRGKNNDIFYEYPLVAYHPDYRLAGGFYRTASALAFVYRTAENFIRLLVWDLDAG